MAIEKHSTAVYLLIEYAENTTIHGVKYLGVKQRPTTHKIFWIAIFVISFIFLGSFVQDVLKKFNQKSVVLVEDDQPTQVHSIPFPAVTICPAVKIANEHFPREEIWNWINGNPNNSLISDLASLICNQQFKTAFAFLSRDKYDITRYLNQSHIELLMKISQNPEDMFTDFRFPSINATAEEMPISYILTNEGVCYTFNLPSEIITDEPWIQTEYKYHSIQDKSNSWDTDDGYYGYPRFPRSVWGSGPENGLHFVLLANIADLNTICQPTQNGYKILLHSPDEYPTTMEKFISIPHNTLAQIKVTPKITKTSADLQKLNPQARHCFFNYERQLKYFTYYNRVNCKLECASNYSQQHYGCVHFSLPRHKAQPICGIDVKISQLYDSEEIMNSYFDFKTLLSKKYKAELENDEPQEFKNVSNFDCNCLPACNSVEYDYSVELENIELEKIQKNTFRRDVNITVIPAIIDIFFRGTKVTATIRKQFYTFSDLVSNIGGLVGLFMGASIISIFEIIYFLVVR